MGKIRRTKKNRTLSGVMVHMFLLVFLGTVSVGIGKQAIRYQEVKEELALVTAEIQAEKEKQMDFDNRKAYYQSDSYIEKIAREQLGMIKSNEIIYVNRSE